MENSQNPKNNRLLRFFVPIATAVVIFINYLAARGYINDKTPEMISDKYPTLITPAGFAFAIWSLIYAGLIAFSFYQFSKAPANNESIRKIRPLFILNCAANCLWLYFWHYEWILASLFIMFVLLGTLILINSELKTFDSKGAFWLARVPFGIYFGWITIATLLNFSIALIYLSLEFSPLFGLISACALILAAAAVSCIVRFNLNLAAYSLTVAWAFTAIAANQTDRQIIFIFALIGAAVSILAAIIPLFQRKNLYQ